MRSGLFGVCISHIQKDSFMAIRKQPPALFISLEFIEDEAVEELDPYAVMWAKIQQIAEVLDVSEEEAQQIVLGRICATPLR